MKVHAELDSPDHICMTMIDISTVSLDLKGARLLQWKLEVNVLSHLHLLIKQRCLTLLGQAAACILQTANDPRRALQHSLHASRWLPSLLCQTNESKPQLVMWGETSTQPNYVFFAMHPAQFNTPHAPDIYRQGHKLTKSHQRCSFANREATNEQLDK